MAPSIQVENPPAVIKEYPPAFIPTELKSIQSIGEREVKNIAVKWLDDLNQLFEKNDYDHIENLFHTESWWRDLLSMKMDHQLLHTSTDIKTALRECGDKVKFSNFTLTPKHTPTLANPVEGVSWIQAFFDYETKIARGKGLFRLLPNTAGAQAQWKCFTMFTSVEELKGYEEKNGRSRPAGVAHGENINRESWADRRHREKNYIDSEPTVLIIGAGQAGLNLGARLGQLNINTLIVDKNDRIGDNWRKRYRFLVLHDPVWYDHMAYIEFPKHWPVFTPKDKLADWFESYAASMELNVWMKTEVKGARWDKTTGIWTVPLKQPDGTMRDMHPKHVVLASGHSGEPNIPHFPGEEEFAGKIVHSSQHTTGGDFKGLNAVVVGCCNSGHDIAHDFYEQGADTTIVQRSSTYIMSSEHGLRILFEGLYEEGGPSVEDGDLIFHSVPNPLHVVLQKATTDKIAIADKPLLDKLQKSGFKLAWGPEGSGFLMLYFKRGGGYYLDVGASSLIADGKIKVKQGQEIKRLHKDSIEFEDGTMLKADVIVLATGYQNMKTTVNKFISEDVAAKCKDVWGLDEQGELSAIWRNSGHENFWFMGGNLALCRYMSKRLALSIKMIEEGIAEHPEHGK